MPGPFDDIKNYARSRGYNLAGMDSPLASLLSLIGRIGTATTPSAGGAPGGSTTQPDGGQTDASGATDNGAAGNGAAGNNANGDGGDNTEGNGTEGNGTDNGDGNGAAATNTGTTTEVTITELKKGDNDATYTWNGQSYPNENGTYVKDLQERLLELGYWVSSPSSSNGRLCDGDYGVTTKGTVALFQLEHMALNPDNSIDESKITGVYDTATITAMEAATTTRPSHKAANLAGDVQFVQLPPSTNYTRYSPQYDDGGEASFTVLSGTNYRFMTDNWARAETVDLIKKVCDEWNNKGKEQLLIGDLSLFHGGDMPSHSTHEEGFSADLDHDKYCSINRAAFDPVEALELVDLFEDEGAEKMYLNCHHVIMENTKTEWMGGHHHHLHIYSSAGNVYRRKTGCGACAKYATCDYKILKVAKKGVANSDETYDPTTTYNNEGYSGLVYRLASSAGNGKYYVAETNSPD
jgi:hypothetical protein